MAARVSKPGAFRVDAARILEGVDPRALGERIEHVSDHLVGRATEKKENERKPRTRFATSSVLCADAFAEFDRPGETSVD
jgi:hypothetical protein